MKKRSLLLTLFLVLCLCFTGCDAVSSLWNSEVNEPALEEGTKEPISVVGFASVEGIPDYSGEPYVVLKDNEPDFTATELTTSSYEFYSELDSLGRCGYTMACVGKDLMPTEDRESISSVKPSGWVNEKYDTELVDGGYIYNRCHLIGFQLTGENANKNNLITGTRYMNVEGMLPFENMVADYVKETGNHVMYRVTPIFVGTNLLASGVRLEAFSVEDNGEGICFHVFVYNVQPGITINYATGDNWLGGESVPEDSQTETGIGAPDYILNVSSKKIHLPTCSSISKIDENNRQEYKGSKDDLLKQGYMICGICKP
ncbi:MAG: DNA/RNA non-specific endonuclease [Clostridia bacterium]|nr:DNA/RNA non-specific endonuclease [Clostridia bacterium]